MLHSSGNHRSIYPVPTGAVRELSACKNSLNRAFMHELQYALLPLTGENVNKELSQIE